MAEERTKQLALEYLNRAPLCHMDMLEPIRRGQAEIRYAGPDGVFLFEPRSRTYMLSAGSREAARRLTEGVTVGTELFVAHHEEDARMLCEKFGYGEIHGTMQAVYTRPAPPAVREAAEIRVLGPEWLPTVQQHYQTVSDGEYLEERLREGSMYGAFWGAEYDAFCGSKPFCGGELAGFIGMHPEGSIGLLTVLPAFRRRGIAAQLEADAVRRGLAQGQTPFSQIFFGNEASFALHEKLGFELSEEPLYWLWKD